MALSYVPLSVTKADVTEYIPAEVSGTGVVSGGVLSVGTPNTTYSISDGSGFITDQSGNKTDVTWSGKTNITPGALLTNLLTWVAIDSGGNVVEQTSAFTATQARANIVLGVIVHADLATVQTVNNEQLPFVQPVNQLYDLAEAIGFINVSGNEFGPSVVTPASLKFSKTSGEMFKFGANYNVLATNPHVKTLAAADTASGGGYPNQFQYRYSDGTSGPLTDTDIDPDNLDDGAGGLTALGNNRWSVQRIYSFVSNNIKLQRGVESFATKAEAIEGFSSEAYVTETSIAANGLLRGYLVVKKGATNLSDIAQAQFLPAPKFGEGSTGGTTKPPGDASDIIVVALKASVGTINIGQVVRATGWNGSQVTVELADADAAGETPAVGVVRETITNTDPGTIVFSGILEGIDTSTYSVNDSLYLSTTPGTLTNVKPTSLGATVQSVAKVLSVNATTGTILVAGAGRVNDIPNFTAADKYWYGDATGASVEGTITAAGRAILDDADAAAQRTTLGAGDVTKVGTPADNQIGVWTGDGTIEGDANLTWDASVLAVTGNESLTGDLIFTERADHASTPGAGFGYLWVKSDTPSSLYFTDDAGTDYDLTAASGGAFTADGDTQITPTNAIILDQATGNEIALSVSYTVNKATSGNDTGLLINQTDTASPGTSLLIDAQVGGLSQFIVNNAGNVGINEASPGAKLHVSAATLTDTGLTLQTTDDNTTNPLISCLDQAGTTELFSVEADGNITAPGRDLSITAGAANNTVKIGTISGKAGVTSTGELHVKAFSGQLLKLGSGGFTAVEIVNQSFRLEKGIRFTEIADHWETPAAGYGQLWVKNDTPNTLYFTDDAGTDYQLTGLGGAGAFSSDAETQISPTNAITLDGSSGTEAALTVNPTYNQTGTAGGTDLLINRTETAVGSGSQLIIDAQVGGASKFSVDNVGDATFTGEIKSTDPTGGIGYGTGAGATVTQNTSKSTAVTISYVCGEITMNAASLASDTTVSFTMTNTTIAASDVVVLNHKSGGTAGAYTLNAQCGAGSATINVRNVTTGSLAEAIVLQFVVIKAVTS